MISIQFSLTTALLLATSVTAFTPQASIMHNRQIGTELRSQGINSDDEAVFVMAKASECANSDTCSIEEAESYLQEVLHLQSGCALGNIRSHDICEDITIPVEIIAGLRHKIETAAKTPANALTIKSMMSPVFVSMFAVYMASSIVTMNSQPGVDPFTSQEFWWATKDGYISDLVSQFVKNGGLSSIDVTNSAVMPFTAEEWMWSIRDGYFGTMMTDYLRNGGI